LSETQIPVVAKTLLILPIGTVPLGLRTFRRATKAMTHHWRSIIAAPLLLLWTGCAIPDFVGYDDQSLADSKVAIVENRWTGCPFCVREIIELTEGGAGLRLVFDFDRDGDRSRLKLLPGRYEIYARVDHENAKGRFREVVDLEAGHVYVVRFEACPTFARHCSHGSAILHLLDRTNGRRIAGSNW
jgi:hypothetical protein